jgi:glycosyltransferase involved in cell wall biosynthesis
MRLLFVADGRSPIALNWMRHWVERGDEVYLASTFTCSPDLALKDLEVVPVAFSGVKTAGADSSVRKGLFWGARTLRLRHVLRQWLGPITVPRAARRLRGFAERIRPDLVHAMRIPYEGMLAADAYGPAPLIVSAWGNDFTLHAGSSPLMRHYTAWTVGVADALHADCYRDVRLAKQWGLPPTRPTLVAPGNGGVRTDVFFPPSKPVEAPVVINPRGFRGYVRNDVFFRAIPLVLAERPAARFICPGMAGEVQAMAWMQELGIANAVELLPAQPNREMAAWFRSAAVLVSPSTHDGTPNSLLEGMACGCFPIAGDLESIREWITPGTNGLLIDPSEPQALAEAILQAINQPVLRTKAAGHNAVLIAERAEYTRTMARAEEFYRQVARK